MGPVDVADMTFSVAKSYLAICAGLAVDDGLISGIDDPVDDGTFDANQNRTITWRHLLRQTSEWEGTLGARPTGSIATGNWTCRRTRRC